MATKQQHISPNIGQSIGGDINSTVNNSGGEHHEHAWI